jgi:carboxypeptidase Taq
MKSYLKLEKHFKRISSIDHASAILGWDESVMMPHGSGVARGQALADLRVFRHEILRSPQVWDLLNQVSDKFSQLNAWQRANLFEMRQLIMNARAVNNDLVEKMSLANTRSEQAWRSLRQDNNWKEFLPLLENVVAFSREEATQRSHFANLDPYDSLLDQFSPGLLSNQITDVFNQVKAYLPDLIQEILEKQKSNKIILPKLDISIADQKNLGIEVMKVLGFKFDQGRLDVSHHPFCGGVPQDVRITTRYSTSNFIESLMGIIHETGHACYEQNLPQEWLHQPVGMARGMHIHESQSLLFEIYLGRSRSFLSLIHPLLIKYLAVDPSHPFWRLENLYQFVNKVEQSLIRVNADEVTYPAHIILRFEIERDLIAGKIEAKDIPELWDQKMQSYLGLPTKDNYRDGCMQDMHWPSGAFGYFPSYSLGAITAAQFFASMRKTIADLDQNIIQGRLEPIYNWLRGHIWSQGSLLRTNDLVVHATGEPLNPIYFKSHLEKKYLA